MCIMPALQPVRLCDPCSSLIVCAMAARVMIWCDNVIGGLAIKVYKTSILVFKDRDKYVTGEYRFRHGYSKSNPRKMVKLWVEKEMRNLKRYSRRASD